MARMTSATLLQMLSQNHYRKSAALLQKKILLHPFFTSNAQLRPFFRNALLGAAASYVTNTPAAQFVANAPLHSLSQVHVTLYVANVL
jgi:hypothetical protein